MEKRRPLVFRGCKIFVGDHWTKSVSHHPSGGDAGSRKHDTPNRDKLPRRQGKLWIYPSEDDIDNQDQNGKDKEWTNRKMPSCKEDISNHIITVGGDETFRDSAREADD